jgi:hypothetical protein
MNRSVLVGLGLVTAITTALAQSADPIVERKNLMKGNGAAMLGQIGHALRESMWDNRHLLV